ncbi:MAG: PEP-CTERM sorting domain-containing protein [Phycisphaerae bacterium]|nr:PEP-CTERM sorting domain-containing protein [Phycisphaerae bacterium]
MEDGVTIKLIDGGGSSAGAAGGVDVALFWALGGAAFDPANITVEAPDGKDWTWDTVGGVPGAAPIIEFVDSQWVVLRGLVTASHPGDANKDAKVDHEDLILFNAQFGLRGPDQSCDFDLDNDVDLDDFKMLKDEWGWVASAPEPGGAPEPAETPEPATMTLLALGGLLVLRRRRRRS